MKQNKYDDPYFFESYSTMARSQEGLKAAGEWPMFRQMLPPIKGKRVLDLGCGYGWHCHWAAQQGARSVMGIDISKKMIGKAKQQAADHAIEYRQMAIEDIDFQHEFDLVISSLAFHYVKDLGAIYKKINQALIETGYFVFSMEHPVFTARSQQDWHVDAEGTRLHWPVDYYQMEGMREAEFLGHKVIKYHRTMETIINRLISAGFSIKRLSEPKPTKATIKEYPEMKDETRRPIFVLISSKKTK